MNVFTVESMDPVISQLLLAFLALAGGGALTENLRHALPRWLGGPAAAE
jgi:hypothetical protein